MASSSLSQEDVDHEYEVQSRRSRVRTARATRSSSTREVQDMAGDSVAPLMVDFPAAGQQQQQQQEHDASPKPRVKDKRCPRPNHANKVKVQRERRKLREKRRSTGVVHLQSTESTGGSTGEEEEELLNMCAETRRNTALNETPPVDTAGTEQEPAQAEASHKFSLRNNKSPSDLDADDEDNQEYDSAVNQSDSTMSLAQESALCQLLSKAATPANGRPQTPCSERPEELLERAREENCRLLDLLKEKDVRIHALEKKVITLGKELGELASENRELRERNAALSGNLAKAGQ